MPEHIQVSPLGFGCASVMGKVDKSRALSAMEMAYDLGVTHFDVARSYGFGRAEEVVGRFIRGKRYNITITTKFGVVPPPLTLKTRILIPVARAVANYVPQLKAKLRSKSAQLLAEKRFDVVYARQCLDDSLRALATDHIDFYLLHEPELALLQDKDKLREFLEMCVASGKIRRWGLAYRTPEDHATNDSMTGGVIQFEGNVDNLESCREIIKVDGCQRFVMRPFAGGLKSDSWGNRMLQEKKLAEVMLDMGVSPGDLSLCLAKQLAGHSGSVVCSMFASQHIRANVRAIHELSRNAEMKTLVEALIEGNKYIKLPKELL